MQSFLKNHKPCPSFLVAAVIFSVFTLTGIVSAAWVDAPNAPPNYGITGCTYPCLEEDFRPMNLGTTSQTKRASITADGFYDRQDPTYVIDPASSLISLNLAGHAVINSNASSIGAQLVVNNPKDTTKTGSTGDAIFAFANSANAAISAEQGNTTGYAIYSSGGINYFGGNVGIGVSNPTEKLTVEGNAIISGNVGIGTLSSTEKLDVNGKIKSSFGGFMFPDGTTQDSAAALLMRAIHTFKDCTAAGGQVFNIDDGKNICRFSSLPAGWTLYPTNWTTTTSVHCEDTKSAPEGWEPKYGTTTCETGGHAFADLPVESCTSVSTGQQCWYEGFFGSNKVCGYVETSTTCYATVTERGGY
ncbi:hypothetical protein A2Z10_03800 [Candidatus Azambacteria bacterium RBG_16_47_10]|uniref:Uncharacterized protein n=1 Tax=Candidatus Azambacteria bacterium RBG_16_47_10 TaxID=1797292 RepID=A0A1F5AXY4_9BACT|nr:MAG: hypothetical protein A2Z10_03800 [Candidatus Azambacteria bacterium RBG_16_47_10]